MLLQEFLDAKPLYYDEIDYTRMPRVWERISTAFRLPKLIHLVGTNGKGTTGRFLASALYAKGFCVGHYSSPHILEFSERIWFNGASVSETLLEEAHTALQKILQPDESLALSYFEYTTLLAIWIYQQCDYVVFEAGLGGEHDATAVFANILTLITPIDRDHEAFLGDTIEKIATTKLRAIQKNAIFASQHHKEVAQVAQKLALERGLELYDAKELLDDEDFACRAEVAKTLHLSGYLVENLTLAMAALKFLNIAFAVQDFKDARLFGRLSPIAPNILLDVGHNALAAQQIALALAPQRYTLIYNSYKDKDYGTILSLLSPIIESVEIIDVDEARIVSRDLLEQTLKALSIEFRSFRGLSDEKNYLVFGSFSVAQHFLQHYTEFKSRT